MFVTELTTNSFTESWYFSMHQISLNPAYLKTCVCRTLVNAKPSYLHRNGILTLVLRFNIETMHYQRKFKFPFVLIFLRVDDTFVCMFDDLSYFKLWLSGLTYQKVYNIGLKRYRGRWGRGDQSVRRILYSLQTFHKKTT